MKMKPDRNSNVRNDDGIDSIPRSGGKSTRDLAWRGSRENRELYVELKMKADELEKEFEAHKRRISNYRSDSGCWSKVPADEEKKGGDIGSGNSLRGELYDKYMEKRAARLRTERGSKLAALNEAKLRTMRNDLERWRVELQEEEKISDARRRLQKFRSFNMRSSPTPEEGEISIRRLEGDGDLMKFSQQKFIQRGWSDSKASKRGNALPVSRSYELKKDFPVRNTSSSSAARAVAPSIPRPSNKLTGYSSVMRRANPENSPDFRKENTKRLPVIGRKANQSTTRNVFQTRIASEDPQKSQLAKKNSASLLGYKGGSERKAASQKVIVQKTENSSFEKYSISVESDPLVSKAKMRAFVYEPGDCKSRHNLSSDMDKLADIEKVDVLSMMFDIEEGDHDLLEKFSKSIDLDPFLGIAHEQNPGNVASFSLQIEQHHGNLTVATDDAGNDEDDLGNSTIAAKDSQDPRSSQESDESGNFESTNGGDLLGSQSCTELSVDIASELPNSADLKNLEPVIIKISNEPSAPQETTPAIVDVIAFEADADQIQRDIEDPLNSVPPASYSHGRSRMGILKAFKRFLILSKKSRGDETLADWLSTMTSEGDDEIIGESIVLEEQVQSLHFPVIAPSERIKRRGGYASERSLKATRSFFSLSSFRCKGDDSKTR